MQREASISAVGWAPLEPRSRRKWILALLVTLLLHVVLLSLPAGWLMPRAPERVEVQTLSPEQLRALKEKWKRAPLYRPNALDTAPEQTPENARYESDRARRVERETRAREGGAVVGEGGRTEKRTAPRSGSESRTTEKSRITPLSQLGMPVPPPRVTSGQAGGTPGREQLLLDENLSEDLRNSLNTVPARHFMFYDRMLQKIAPFWESRLGTLGTEEFTKKLRPQSYITQVEFILDEDGRVESTTVTESSDIPEFDQAVVWAIQKAAQFQNPPKELRSADGKTRIQQGFLVQISERAGIQMHWSRTPPPSVPR